MIAAGWSPSVRLFEAGACGTPIVSDRWPGIEDVFTPGREIVLADSADDVLAALDLSADAIGEAARAAVLARHGAESRAEQLETDLSDAAAAGPQCIENRRAVV
jgi:spore maturation protein CgeB